MPKRKRQPGCPCCDCPYCLIFEDQFNTDLTGWGATGGTAWSVSGGSAVHTAASEFSALLGVDEACFPSMVADADLTIGTDGDSAYIIIAHDAAAGTGLYAKFTKATPNHDIEIGEFTGGLVGGTYVALDSVTTTFPGSARLCYNAAQNKLTLQTGATVLLEGYPTETITGKFYGIAAEHNGMGSTTITYGSFAVYVYDEDCEECNATCTDCCDDNSPSTLDVELSGFTNGDCGDCTSLDDTYNLTAGEGFLTPDHGLLFGSNLCQKWGYSDPAITFCSVTPVELSISAALAIDQDTGECKMVVAVLVVGFRLGAGFGIAAVVTYASDFEAVDSCAAKVWTCDLVDNELAGHCSSVPASVTVTAV